MMRVNGLAWRYEVTILIAQSTARSSLSVGDFFSFVFDHRWLVYASFFPPFPKPQISASK